MGVLFALLGCDGFGLVVLPSTGVATVGHASWTASADERTRLVVEGEEGRRVEGAWHEAGKATITEPILGLKARTDYDVLIEPEAGTPGESVAFSTGALPNDLPLGSVEGTPGWHGFLVTSVMGNSQWALVLDEDGDPVWYVPVPEDGRLVRVRLRKDGRGIWAVPAIRTDRSLDPDLIGYDWDGVELERLTMTDFSHDFLEVEVGVIASLDYDVRDVEGKAASGNVITELDVATEARTHVFSSYDLWTPSAENMPEDGDWAGGNALDFDEASQTYVAGFRQLGAIVEVDRASGAVGRQLGGPSSDYVFPEGSLEPHRQHQFQWRGDDCLVFDNRDDSEDSRVVEYTLDGDVATEVWTHETAPPVWVFALGDVDRAADGSTFVDWASAGILEDLDPAGAVRWSLVQDLGAAFGFLDRTPALGGYTRAEAN